MARTAVQLQCPPAWLHRVLPHPPLILPDDGSLLHLTAHTVSLAAQATMAEDGRPQLNRWLLVHDSGMGGGVAQCVRISIALLDGKMSKQFGNSPPGELLYKPMVQIDSGKKQQLAVLYTSAGGAAGAGSGAGRWLRVER